MINTKKTLILILIFPILSLAVLTGHKKYVLSFGKEFVFPITGYDPKHPLSGHYLRYRINYGVKNLCKSRSRKFYKKAYFCLNPKEFSYNLQKKCKSFIVGNCSMGRFHAGIERYYIPEKRTKEFSELFEKGNISIKISVLENGTAQVKHLLINGEPFF